jgi:RND family efflux transporter MFP subunit
MSMKRTLPISSRPLSFAVYLAFTWAALPVCRAAGPEITGFTQPYETVHVAAPELGIVSSLSVKEGDEVKAGQIIASLDDDVLRAMLATAQAKAEFKGSRKAAEAVVRQRNTRWNHMEKLHADGHASAEELERADVDREIAAANLVTAQEELKSHELHVRQIAAELERRTIRSPIDGVVTEIARHVGELVTTNNARVATIVRLAELRVTFYLPTSRIVNMFDDGVVHVRFVDDESVTQGRVEFISPITDAESDTVRIEVVIDNRPRQFRSGLRCVLLDEDDRSETTKLGTGTHIPRQYFARELTRANPLRPTHSTRATTATRNSETTRK